MVVLRPDHIFRFNLDDLYDTSVASPSNNQLLSYNSTSGKWEGTLSPTLTSLTVGTLVSTSGSITSGDTSNTGSFILYDGSDHKITITAPSIGADYTLTLPTTDGDASQYLQTNGSGTLTWATVIVADEKVKVDSGATAGYLGAAYNDGVLRTGTPLTYTDGGNFVTLDLNESDENLVLSGQVFG